MKLVLFKYHCTISDMLLPDSLLTNVLIVKSLWTNVSAECPKCIQWRKKMYIPLDYNCIQPANVYGTVHLLVHNNMASVKNHNMNHNNNKYDYTILSLNNGRFHLVQVHRDAQLLVLDHLLLLVHRLLDLLTHHLESPRQPDKRINNGCEAMWAWPLPGI